MRQRILDIIDDMMSDLLYYRRKEDNQLPVGAIERAIRAGEVSVDEIAGKVRAILEAAIREGE